MLIASATYQRDEWSSPNVEPSSTGQHSSSTLKENITEIRNQPLQFKRKHSCWSSVKRALLCVFRKITSVFHKKPAEFASPVAPKCLTAAPDITRSELMTTTPTTRSALRYLDHLVRETCKQWTEQNQETGSIHDEDKRSRFINETLKTLLQGHSREDYVRMLHNLEGGFGYRLRSVLDFAAFKTGFNDIDPYMISHTRNLMTFINHFPIALREILAPLDTYTQIDNYNQLTSQEIKALSTIGIHAQMLGG